MLHSVDAQHDHGYPEYVEALLTIDDSQADDPRQYFRMSQSSPLDIRAFATSKRLKSIVTLNDGSLFRVFSLRAMLAICPPHLEQAPTRELHRLLSRPLSLFNLVYPETTAFSATWEGKIMLAVGFVAEASLSRSKDKAFQSLANARAVLPCLSKLQQHELIGRITGNKTDSASNQSQLSVRALGTCTKPLRLATSTKTRLQTPRSGGHGY